METMLSYLGTFNLSQLHDEVQAAAIPGLAPIDGHAVYALTAGRQGSDDSWELADTDSEGFYSAATFYVPDPTLKPALDAVVKAHVAKPLAQPADPLEQRLVAALEALPPDRVVSASELLAIIQGA